MPFHVYRVEKGGEPSRWFGIRVEFVDDRWVATCGEVTAAGEDKPDAKAIAPRFYGVTAEQAQRRMLDALENSYDEVVSQVEGRAE